MPRGEGTQRVWPPAVGKYLIRQVPRAPYALRTPKCVTGNGEGSTQSMSTLPEVRSRTVTLPHLHSNKNFLNSFGFINPGVGIVTYAKSFKLYGLYKWWKLASTKRNDIQVSTLSGFCRQCLITDWVFSQPPRIISYMGSTSAGAVVRLTWQLWGPR